MGPDQTPYDRVLDQIAELMQYAYDNAQTPIDPTKSKALEAKLDQLEKEVAELKKEGEKFLEGSGLSDYNYTILMEDSSKTVSTTLNRAEELKKEAQKASQDALTAAQDAKESGKKLSGKKKEKVKSPQARKGKFKSMGGFKDWKPL